MIVQRTIWFNIAMGRTCCIATRLQKEHNFNMSDDLDAIRLIALMVVSTTNSNELIIKDFLDMHKVDQKEFSAKKS